MFESKSGVLLVAGIGFFALAFLSNGLVPWLMYAHLPEKTAEEMVTRRVLIQFQDLARRYPEAFERHFGDPTREKVAEFLRLGDYNRFAKWVNSTATKEKCAEALRVGRKVYVGEGCWHCHSQFVRPVANEEARWGMVSRSDEYQNELQRPVMFGTRRVGPDLIREGDRRSNDWHVAHFFRPRMTSPESVMPEYPWFFDDNHSDGPGTPNRRGFALITYMQWLGSWNDTRPIPTDQDYGAPR